MSSNVERAREIVKRLYERNLISWNDLDREVVFVLNSLNAEVGRLEAISQPKKLEPNDSFERDAAAAARVREFMRNH